MATVGLLRPAFAGALRLGLVYAALYAGNGIASPYMPLWFRAAGLSGEQIGVILAAPMLARIVTGPALGLWADGFALRRRPVVILLVLALAAYSSMAMLDGFAALAVAWFVAATAVSACSPLVDVIVLRRADRDGFAYATSRGLGSAAYVGGNITAGMALATFGPPVALLGTAAMVALAVLAAHLLLPPEMTVEAGPRTDARSRSSVVHNLMRDPMFMLMIVAAGLIQAANAFYYAFSVLIWREQGIDAATTGLLWGLGVAAEVAFLWFMEPWRRRLTPEKLLIVAGLASVVRWTALAACPPLWMLWPLQILHALTLCAPFLASLQLKARFTRHDDASVAQQINGAMASGLLSGLATLGSGALYERVGVGGYLFMSWLSLMGLTCTLALLRRQAAVSLAALVDDLSVVTERL